MTTITIRFRAKRDEFNGGHGYKVPALRANHYSFSDRDTLAVLLSASRDLPLSLGRYGVEVPTIVYDPADTEGAAHRAQNPDWYRDSSQWTVIPVGSGFMADVTLTRELVRASATT